MALRAVTMGGKTIWIEVAELPVEGAEEGAGEVRFQPASPPCPAPEAGQPEAGAILFEDASAVADRFGDLADTLRDAVGVVTAPIHAAFERSKADEWSVELHLGFKADGGIPFLAKGEANAVVKVTAKWKKA